MSSLHIVPQENAAGHTDPVRHDMTMKLLILMLTLICAVPPFCPPSWAGDNEIIGPELKFQDNQISVTTTLALSEKSLQELRNGVTKELKFNVDLFRVWNMWPDEYVAGKSFIRTLKSDPVTLEYKATSNDGNTIIQKKFKSFETMLGWALFINDVKLANLRDLEPGSYFVRITVQSKIRKLPPVIGYFMIFLPENEFEIRKDSSPFAVGTQR